MVKPSEGKVYGSVSVVNLSRQVESEQANRRVSAFMLEKYVEGGKKRCAGDEK